MKPVDMTRTGFLEESPGVKSSMRLMSFILLLFFIAFNTFYIYWLFQYRIALANAHVDVTVHMTPIIDLFFCLFDFVLLVGIFIPKYLQSLAELASKAALIPLPKTTSQSTSTSTSSTEVKQ